MRLFSWWIQIRQSQRTVTAVLLLVSVFVAFLPISIVTPLSSNGKDHSTPFPCQDRPCGCRTAEQCKKKCCCFNTAQKLAWAKQNDVPASAVVDLELVVAKPVCEPIPNSTRKSCCSGHRVTKASPKTLSRISKSTAKPRSRHKVVIGIVAQECQGLAQTLFGQAIFVIPQPAELKPFVESNGVRFISAGTLFLQRFIEPPVPPPRLCLA
jgi:hypothetical protein